MNESQTEIIESPAHDEEWSKFLAEWAGLTPEARAAIRAKVKVAVTAGLERLDPPAPLRVREVFMLAFDEMFKAFDGD